ncbi:MAG: 50S ribosomal protein L4, partial [Bacteroidetes bacterium]|nr:50S ribosomal protein L4 [Bacteroidota bacterium]
MKIEVYKIDGTKTGKQVELNPEIFEIVPHDHSIYLAVKLYNANQRQGTHKTKERNEVRGG